MHRLSTIWLVLGATAALLTCFSILWYLRVQRQPKSEVHTSKILDYSGPLDASTDSVKVKIYKIEKFSTGVGDTEDTFQNRIELDGAFGHTELTWPHNARSPFAGRDAVIRDVDRDGGKEILIYDGGQHVRIISYLDGELRFRPESDDLDCGGYGVGPVDLRQDTTFVCGVPFPSHESDSTVFIPRLFQWTTANGFSDASERHRDYYEQKLLPDLYRKVTEERDGGRRNLYNAAIQELKNELKIE